MLIKLGRHVCDNCKVNCRPMRVLLFLISLCLSIVANAQIDTLAPVPRQSKWRVKPVSPLKASVFSALIPGAGQVYNGIHAEKTFFGKYWKVPVVYAGIGTCLAFIQFNTKQYRYFRKQYISSVDNDPNTIAEINASTESINRVQEQYHQWMDLSYICLAGVYVLQIIEANVDAHLFYFDVSPNLSFQLNPTIIQTPGKPYSGLSFSIANRTKKKQPCKSL